MRARLLAACAIACAAGLAQTQSLSLRLAGLEGEGWKTGALAVSLEADGSAHLALDTLEIAGRRIGRVELACARFTASGGTWRCDDGRLGAPEALAVRFVLVPSRGELRLSLAAPSGERVVFESTRAARRVEVEGLELKRLADWLPGDIKPGAGRASGVLQWDEAAISADLRFQGAAFSDSAGLRAGENLDAALALKARRAAAGWLWDGRLAWERGAVLVDPVYVAEGGHVLEARGRFDRDSVAIDVARLGLRGIGEVEAAAVVARGGVPVHWSVAAPALALDGLRAWLPQTWLEQHGLADLTLGGRAAVRARGTGAEIAALEVRLDGGTASAASRGLALRGLDLDAGYEPGKTRAVRLDLRELRLRDLAIGPVAAEGEIADGRLLLPNLIAPLLDGVLALNEIEVARPAGRWRARVRGAFTPLSMERLTAALGWPSMAGSISGVLPQIHYDESEAGSTLGVDGALLFKVFGGDATVDGIRVDNLFGRTPRLAANLKLTGMDLEAMTRAVKFGSITGRANLEVKGLEMENWQPLAFDARFATAEGDFPRRISQRAVQNISSIGGAGAGAAIQASFLRFFETFGSRRIALSCRLVAGVCEMGGLDRGEGGFTLIEGGGLPSLTVVGYNRFVGWQEMLDRIRSVIDGNTRMIVQ